MNVGIIDKEKPAGRNWWAFQGAGGNEDMNGRNGTWDVWEVKSKICCLLGYLGVFG